MTRSLQTMADRLLELGVTKVVMKATSDYWKSPFYLLEAHGFGVWPCYAKDVKHLPGRPKTDRPDAVWLCRVAERQMIRPSFVPPQPIRQLRDLTRCRVALVADSSSERNRVEKLLQDAHIKLSVVAQLARARMRVKIPQRTEAFQGYFTDHHGFLLCQMLTRIDQIGADVAALNRSRDCPFRSGGGPPRSRPRYRRDRRPRDHR